jgi:hypothetical protein
MAVSAWCIALLPRRAKQPGMLLLIIKHFVARWSDRSCQAPTETHASL